MNDIEKYEWTKNTPPYLTAIQVSKILGLSVQHIYRLASDGRLPSLKMGRNRRFKSCDVLVYIERKGGWAIDVSP